MSVILAGLFDKVNTGSLVIPQKCAMPDEMGLLGEAPHRSFASLRMTAGSLVILSEAKDLWQTYGKSPGAL